MAIFIGIDIQNDFITGSLANPEADKAVPRIVDFLRKDFNIGEDTLYLTMDTHGHHYLETFEGRNLPVSHCIQRTWGWEIDERLHEADIPWHTIGKPTFGSLQLIDTLKTDEKYGDVIDDIVIFGFCTDICVVSNALLLRAAFPNAHIRCIADCCAGVTPEKHEAALEVMKSCQIEVI